MRFLQPDAVAGGNPDLRRTALHRRDSSNAARDVGENYTAPEVSRGQHNVYRPAFISPRSLLASAAEDFQ